MHFREKKKTNSTQKFVLKAERTSIQKYGKIWVYLSASFKIVDNSG